MQRLARLRKFLTGTVTGSYIAVFNPFIPMGMTQECYTLEELAYQDSRDIQRSTEQGWSFQWVSERGFVLAPNRDGHRGLQTVGLRRAVFRSVVGKSDR